MIELVDEIINRPVYLPLHGWHDDHRDADGTAEYRPALMQVRSEFAEFLDRAVAPLSRRSACLQLGLGNCEASHAVWSALFPIARTVDFGQCIASMDFGISIERWPGADTHAAEALRFARVDAPYDLLFVDAGHELEDVRQDYEMYAPLVRSGGVIAFHDSLPRAGYEEVKVHEFVATLQNVRTVGSEVGISWLIKS